MLLKRRDDLIELELMKCLRGRVTFSEKEERQFRFLVLGEIGENIVNNKAACLEGTIVQIQDLVISQDRICQIDLLLIGSQKIHILDAKHWEGTYKVGPDGFMDLTHDPLHQLERAKRMVAEILRKMRVPLPVEARLVFTNPNVTLYGLTAEMPIVLPQQLDSYFQKIRMTEAAMSDWQLRLGERFVGMHVNDNRYRKLMSYDHDSVRPGIMCGECRGVMREHSRKMLGCSNCGLTEPKLVGLKRTKKEFERLFPNHKKPVESLYRWCGGLVSKRSIYEHTRKNKVKN
ncbi:nuclease-related domain-containing protein [Jeotgalibaca sp. A122]|uniref:nuclease-related domain-containing protein n=1 Tax=Jeotgalibaca sp. A122 TaxID=3457322 RepID=UPI003FD62BDE